MARPKRPPHPLLNVARVYLDEHMPDLKGVPLRLRQLDGPPGAPRYVVTAEVCHDLHDCPFGVSAAAAEAGNCPVLDCPLRNSVRLLFDREGEVVKTMQSGIHWT